MNPTIDTVSVFAYGSLIWRPDFEFVGVCRARVHGYERRFWQASHDHRGTPELPGRVVTLVPVRNGYCDGLLYQLPAAQQGPILAQLDVREQDGYERAWLPAIKSQCGSVVSVLTWLASEGNPSWVGDETIERLAHLIANRRGPSGSNKEYLLRLHAAFDQYGIADKHVESLVDLVTAQSSTYE